MKKKIVIVPSFCLNSLANEELVMILSRRLYQMYDLGGISGGRGALSFLFESFFFLVAKDSPLYEMDLGCFDVVETIKILKEREVEKLVKKSSPIALQDLSIWSFMRSILKEMLGIYEKMEKENERDVFFGKDIVVIMFHSLSGHDYVVLDGSLEDKCVAFSEEGERRRREKRDEWCRDFIHEGASL